MPMPSTQPGAAADARPSRKHALGADDVKDKGSKGGKGKGNAPAPQKHDSPERSQQDQLKLKRLKPSPPDVAVGGGSSGTPSSIALANKVLDLANKLLEVQQDYAQMFKTCYEKFEAHMRPVTT